MALTDDELVEVGGKPPVGSVWVPTALDPVTGEPCHWRWVPKENAASWDARKWG